MVLEEGSGVRVLLIWIEVQRLVVVFFYEIWVCGYELIYVIFVLV